jgi:hypothetical protein
MFVFVVIIPRTYMVFYFLFTSWMEHGGGHWVDFWAKADRFGFGLGLGWGWVGLGWMTGY